NFSLRWHGARRRLTIGDAEVAHRVARRGPRPGSISIDPILGELLMRRVSLSLAFVSIVVLGSAGRLGADEPPALAQFNGWVTASAFSPDGTTLATVGGETLLYRPGFVRLWDVATGQEKGHLDGHQSTVWAVAFSPDGKTLATSSYDKQIKLWNLEGM